jgi:hypothetical protein
LPNLWVCLKIGYPKLLPGNKSSGREWYVCMLRALELGTPIFHKKKCKLPFQINHPHKGSFCVMGGSWAGQIRYIYNYIYISR